ncbi:probable jasmonic acid carboxyl methyltransferase 2 [Aristolochia californica]|uniref:probable jasmonic acid carboxyl methyltransferase 2 n=1 Tax=Aristolochia californica TaxID=171875 RepID=UPI0035DE383B
MLLLEIKSVSLIHLQSKIISLARTVRKEAIQDICSSITTQSLSVAELGCSCGPTALSVITELIDENDDKCQSLCRPTPQIQVFLNDLPENDFTNIFSALPGFYKKVRETKGDKFPHCFVSVTPGSFYGRLFPSKSLQFIHSSSSLHWLSQVPLELKEPIVPPLNKGKLYISKTSPPNVYHAYLAQFQRDFSQFLQSRSAEVAPGGRMVLSFVGRPTADPTTEEATHQWELIAQALHSMAAEGLIDGDEIDSLDVPYYSPSTEELTLEIEREGSFVLDHLEIFQVDWDATERAAEQQHGTRTLLTRGRRVAKTIRAVVESMLTDHFGHGVMNELFQRYEELVEEHLLRKNTQYSNFVLSLLRKH